MSGAAISSASPSPKGANAIKVLVVDDSAVIRGIVSRWIDAAPDMMVAGRAVNGQDALERAKTVKPDVVILDIEMPVMDGITVLPLLLRACPNAKVIMASTLTRRNAEMSLKALALGACDYVPKPTSIGSGDAAEDFRRELLTRISAVGRKRLFQTRATEAGLSSAGKAGGATTPAHASRSQFANKHPPIVLRNASFIPPQIVAIGASTGGPQALVQVVLAIAPHLNVPVLITQHMPATFTTILAESLSRSSGLKCVEGSTGMRLEPGHVYIAPGDYHMIIKGKGGPIELNQNAPENFCRPAVDPMFRSVAAAYGAATLAIVLTGMGADGREGARAIAGANGTILAQDEASSVVWGMPGAVAQAGLASAVLPIQNVGLEIRKYLGLKAR
ncbi:MAG: chemotaxis response regulator protein-glutamate methylesterase [Micropepsaceae bacterium]